MVSKLVIVHVFHILFVGGLFLYLGIRKNEAPSWLYPALIFLGIAIIIAHGLKLLKNHYSIVSWFHVLIVAPLVIYIGRTGPKTPDIAYNLILLEGVLAIGYHSYAIYTGS
jgi:peptidoglycan/LPS O-acetylase OafA/YrhL